MRKVSYLFMILMAALLARDSAALPAAPDNMAGLAEPSPTPTAAPAPEDPKYEEAPAAGEAESPPVPGEKQIREQFQKIRREYNNEDIVGHLKIEGTSIDYAVVQGEDNSFYLRRDINKNESQAGSIFLDYENDVARGDKNTVIYGHNMKAGTMFHDLRYYQSRSFYEEHRYITFNTVYDDFTWEVFAFCRLTTDIMYTQVVFPGEEYFAGLIALVKDLSLYDTEVETGPEDRILTLSTCSDGPDNERFALFAKLVGRAG